MGETRSQKLEVWWEEEMKGSDETELVGSQMGQRAVKVAPTPISLLLALALPLVLLFLFLVVHRRRKRRGAGVLPPSPAPSLPIIGHLLHVLASKEPPHVSLYNLSRQYGPLVSLRLGQQHVIVASTPAAARSILQTQDTIFAARPQLEVPVQLHGCSDILFADPSDPHWKLLRQLFSSHFFTKKRLEAFQPVRAQEVRALLSSILTTCHQDEVGKGTPISIRAHAHALTSNIMCRMAFGKRLPDLAAAGHADWPFRLVIDLMTEMNDLLQVFSLADYFPFLAPFDIQGYGKQTRALAKRFDAVFHDIIESRIDERRISEAKIEQGTDYTPDFLDVLLQSASLPEGNPHLTYQNVKAALMNLFGGGVDTAALTIERVLGELLANPSKMRRLQEEVAEVVGTARLVEEADLSKLPYLQAVVKETMRLHPVIPLLIPHYARTACEVMGYHIPANTVAYINAWAIGRDPNTWERPLEFLPERFEGKSIDVSGKDFELLPFGAGRRGCPGWMLGLNMVQIGAASLVQAFEWELDMSGLPLTSANPLTVRASPKLPARVLQSEVG